MLLGFAAMVVDLGVLRNANQNLWNSLDSGALAGAAYLPDDGVAAKSVGMTYANANYPGGLPASRVALSFRCLIGDRNNDGLPDLTDIPTTCDPGVVSPSAWTCARGICTAPCDPAAGDQCNTLVLVGSVSVPFRFGGAVGVTQGDTNVITSAACRGPCGSLPVTPVDVALIVDRTSSMSGVDTTNARTAADSVRTLYNPAAQWLSFGMLGPSQVGGSCATTPASSHRDRRPRRRTFAGGCRSGCPARGRRSPRTTRRRPRRWPRRSPATRTRRPAPTSTTRSRWPSTSSRPRPGRRPQGHHPDDRRPAEQLDRLDRRTTALQADAAATAAKAAGTEIFTVGFGLDGSNDIACPDTSGAWKGKMASQLVASMATSSAADNGCPGTENDDGDHYFCVPKTAGASANLTNVFKTAANTLAQGTKLVELP